jgi:hypothetical protein
VREELTIMVPAGVDDGHILRLKLKGDDAPGRAPPGNLLVHLRVAPHPRLRRREADLLIDVEVDAELARRGGSLRVPVLGGEKTVHVPPGTRTGAQTILKGHGAMRLGAEPVPLPDGAGDPYRSVGADEGRGDQIVTWCVQGEAGAEPVERSARRRRGGALVRPLALAAALILAVLAALLSNR